MRNKLKHEKSSKLIVSDTAPAGQQVKKKMFNTCKQHATKENLITN